MAVKKILFVGHEASKTGAPLILLYFIQWLKSNRPDISIHIILLKGGDLVSEYAKYADKVILSPDVNYGAVNRIKYLTRKTLDKLLYNQAFESRYLADKLKRLSDSDYDVIYANTIITIPVATKLKKISKSTPKLIAHVHEMNTIIRISLPDFNQFIPHINQFIAVSKPVAENLLKNWNIPSGKITLVYEFTRVETTENYQTSHKSHFVCGASGVAHWRKGDDVFLQLAAYVKRIHPDAAIKFQWVGGIPEQHLPVVEEDIKKLGLEQTVEFTGETVKPFEYFKDFDVFLMVSREDPFPLVCIEAAMMEKPIICFEKATGTADILQNGGGYIVPYLNIQSMAEKILEYYHSPDLKSEHGKYARELFNHFTPEKICPEIMNVILRLHPYSD